MRSRPITAHQLIPASFAVAMEEPLPPLAATLRKVGEWTKLPHARFVVLTRGSPAAPPRLEYWLSPSHARGGAAPKGGGSLVAVDEWWPQPAEDAAHGFVLAFGDGAAVTRAHFLACSVGQKLAWMAAAAEGLPGGAAPSLPAETLAEAARPLLEHAWRLWHAGDGAAAEELYREILRCSPRCWMALQDRGNFHLSLRRLHRAEADFSAALHLCGTSAALWNDRAAARFEAGRVREALADVESALALRPDFAEALSNRGNIWRALGDERKAREDYGAALLLAPTDARTWNNRAALHADAGNLIAASLDLKRALELDEEYVKAAENYERVAAQLAMLEPEFELQPLR